MQDQDHTQDHRDPTMDLGDQEAETMREAPSTAREEPTSNEFPETTENPVPLALTPAREPDPADPPLRRSTRTRQLPERYRDRVSGTVRSERTRPARIIAMSTAKALLTFPIKETEAIRSEVKSLLGKETFEGTYMSSLSQDLKHKTLQSMMRVDEKFIPRIGNDGNRLLDKIKARFCVDGRGQIRADYLPEEIESPTACIPSVFTVSMIAAAQGRCVRVGDVGTAYLNAFMPSDDPNRRVHIMIDKEVAKIICEEDPTFIKFLRPDGRLLVRLRKALYGCIESAKLWHDEISGTLKTWGFVPNLRDPWMSSSRFSSM